MKRKLFFVILTICLLSLLLVACGPEKPNDNPDVSTGSDVADVPDEPAEQEQLTPIVNGRWATLQTADATLKMYAWDNKLGITSLCSAGGYEAVPSSSVCTFPTSVKIDKRVITVNWTFSSIEEVNVTENGVACRGVRFIYVPDASQAELTLQLIITVLARPSLAGPFEYRTEVVNVGSTALRLNPGSFASVAVQNGGDLVLIKKESGMAEGYKHYDGQMAMGLGIYRYAANEKVNVNAWVTTFQSWNESGYFPMIYQDRTENGFYCALEWSSGCVSAKGKGDTVTFSVNMDHEKTFTTMVPAGDTLTLPSVYFGVYDGTLDEGSNVFKKWFFACKVQPTLRDNPNEPLSQMDMQTGIESNGLESIKWDYGWWTEETTRWSSLEGSWQLRSDGYIGVLNAYGCSTLAEFGALVREKGLNWTVYVLLHDTLDENDQPTDAYGEFNSFTHPEWFSGRVIAYGMGATADLGNEECVAYLKKAMTDFFKNNNISTWRSDFEPICYVSKQQNRHDAFGSDVMYWCTVGFRELVTHLYENVEGFRYESCSSGGSMKDLFTATLAVSINTDDAANYMSMRTTFYDSSYIIHPSQLQMPCNSDFFNVDCATLWPVVTTSGGDDFDFKKNMLDMGYRTQCLGSPMFSSWTMTVMTDYYDYYSVLYANKIRPLVRDGDLYHILPRPDGKNYDGVMYADADSANEIKGLVFLFKPSENPGDVCHITLQGLYADTTYQLTFEDRPEQNCVKTGAELMTDGLDVTILYVGSELIWITEVN